MSEQIRNLIIESTRRIPLSRVLLGYRFPLVPIFMLHRFEFPGRRGRGHSPDFVSWSLQELRRMGFTFLDLGDVVTRISVGERLPPRSACFTVDDGYFDQAEIGGDLFAEFDVPATFFVTTGFLDGSCWLWDSLVEFIVRNSEVSTIQFADFPPVSLEAGIAARLALVRRIVSYLKGIDGCLVSSYIEDLGRAAEVDVPLRPAEEFRPMSWAAARALESRGMRVAPHSVSHAIMSRLDVDTALVEVQESWARVQAEMKQPLGVYCFPSGCHEDFNSRDVRVVRDSGLLGAVSAIPGYANSRPGSIPFDLPRFSLSNRRDFLQIVTGLERLKELFS